MKRALLVAAVLLLDACALVPADRSALDLFDDARFQPLDAPIDGEAVFALSAPMRRYLEADVARQSHVEGPQLGLIHALQASGQINLEYDAAITRNAAEAFEARAGNCLSLVILTAALAQELGLDVQFQEVLGDHVMSRNGDLVFYSGHVNVVLRERRSEPGADSAGMLETVIDFLPSEERDALKVKTTSRRTVIAMYMNNRAAELLAAGNVNDAYWWARAAIVLEPRYTTTYNTLGLVYRRHGDMQEAADVFEYALALEPARLTAMSNLIPVLRSLGRVRDAERWARRLKELQPFPPFHFFEQGRLAMQRGDFALARQQFAREIEGAAYYHEFHYWLALAYVGLQQPALAREHFIVARNNATHRDDVARYQAALDAQDSGGDRNGSGSAR